MAEHRTTSLEREVALAMQWRLVTQEAQIRAWHTRIEAAFDGASWDFYSLAAVTHNRERYQESFADALAQMALRREQLAHNAAKESAAMPQHALEAERAAWQDIVEEFARPVQDSVERLTQTVEHAPFPDEAQVALPANLEDLQPAELREQIAAIQERLDANLPAEDWSHPGRYYGTYDDELETRLLSQLERLQARLETLTQSEARPHQHREEGMGY
jgi:hypothetical protein